MLGPPSSIDARIERLTARLAAPTPDDDVPGLTGALGMALLERYERDWDEPTLAAAVARLTEAVTAAPWHADRLRWWYRLGRAFAYRAERHDDLADYDRAIDWWNRVLAELPPDDPERDLVEAAVAQAERNAEGLSPRHGGLELGAGPVPRWWSWFGGGRARQSPPRRDGDELPDLDDEHVDSYDAEAGPPRDPAGTIDVEPEPERYLVGELPDRVRVGRELSLIVSIGTRAPEPGLAAAALLGFSPGPWGTDVTLVVRADAGLVPLDEAQCTVRVPRRGDAAPVRFAYRARTVGLSRIRVTAWLGGTFLAELRLEVSVEADEPVAGNQRRDASMAALRADPGEVTLQVHNDGSRYSFQLLSQRYLSEPVVARSLTEEPGEAVERTVAMLRRMAGDTSGYSPALAARWVRETGAGLWRDLVPQSIQEQFWALRDSITAFTIACADDTVPWELLYPLTPTEDAGFLVEQFPVLRRVFDQSRASRVLLGEPRYVVPPGSPDNAQDEVAAIGRVLGQPGATVTDLAELLDLLDAGGTGLLHFACHNTFSLDGGGSSIAMAGGPFVPQLLTSAVARRRLAGRSPLVFVNACRSAGVAAQYTRMMGWAGQFMAAGAGAFVGTLWPVRSSRASQFAEAFYAALVAGQNLGAASLSARRATRDDADPTWLAYSAYGDPTAMGSRR